MGIFYAIGNIDLNAYQRFCAKDQSNSKGIVFIFPGNASHHRDHTLFSIKSGAGLAQASSAIGSAGYPTLSLPTTNMEQWDTNEEQKAIVKNAIKDLYKAVGAGYSLMLPVRGHNNTKYFDSKLEHGEFDCEPNFWGGVQSAKNKSLSQHYITCLNELRHFIELNDDDKDNYVFRDGTCFMDAYEQGKDMALNNDPWLKKSNDLCRQKRPNRTNRKLDVLVPDDSSNESASVEFSTMPNINMQLLGGFISVIGVAAVAVAFVALNAATFGVAGLTLAGCGVSAIGFGFFVAISYKKDDSGSQSSFIEGALASKKDDYASQSSFIDGARSPDYFF